MLTLFILIFFVYLQSCLFAKLSSLWFHIDIVSIAVVYICIEHFLPFAILKIMFAAILMQISSAAPSGFYIMYFLLILVFSNLLSKILIFSSILGQVFIFLILFFLKYILFYFSIYPRDISIFYSLFSISWQGFLTTILLVLPMFRIFIFVDSFFEFIPSHDKRKVSEV